MVLIKRTNGQYDWVAEEAAHKLIQRGSAKQCDPKTFKVLEKQPVKVEKPEKKKSKKPEK